jgi:hypothetical protein
MHKRIQWTWALDPYKHFQCVSVLFEPLPWLSAIKIAEFGQSLEFHPLSDIAMYPPSYLTGTEDFKNMWDQAVVDYLSGEIYKHSAMSSEGALEGWGDRMDLHGQIAHSCMCYLGLQSISFLGDLSYEDDLAMAYAKQYWAKHLALASLPNSWFYHTLMTFATEWTTLNLDAADAHLVVQWLKVSKSWVCIVPT